MRNRITFYLSCLMLFAYALQAQDISVVSINPADGTTQVPQFVTLTIVFSKPLDTSGKVNFGESEFPVDYELRPLTTELDNVFENLSPDGTTLTLTNVQLKSGTQYTFAVLGAFAADGSTLKTPAISVFTTGTSLATGSISGKISKNGNGVAGALVGAFDGSVFNDQTYGTYTVADASGNYQFSTLPPGNYQVIAMENAVDDGDFDPTKGDPVGAYDPDGNGFVDWVPLTDGQSVTGIDFSVSDQSGGGTARDFFTRVDAFAKSLGKVADPQPGDAELVSISTFGIDLTGKAFFWFFQYYSPSQDTSFFFGATKKHVFGGIAFSDSAMIAALDTLHTPLPSNWMNSDNAIAVAQANGGADFVGGQPDSVEILALGFTVNLDSLFAGVPAGRAKKGIRSRRRNFLGLPATAPPPLRLARSGGSAEPYWLFSYTHKSSQQMEATFDLLMIAVHMVTGEATILSPSFAPAIAGVAAATVHALTLYSDAVLVGIAADPFSSVLRPDGEALFWRYVFWSATANIFLELIESSGRMWSVDTTAHFPSQKPLPQSFVDSDVALQKAEAKGGAAFRAQHPFSEVQALLSYGIYVQDPNRLVWHILYSDFTLPEDQWLNIFIDGVTGDVVVGVEDAPFDGPVSFRLLPVYPNPVGASRGARIEFELSQPAQVEVKLYNTLGQEVKSLFVGTKPIGRQRLQLQNALRGLSSGVYFVRVKAQMQDGRVQLVSRPLVIQR